MCETEKATDALHDAIRFSIADETDCRRTLCMQFVERGKLSLDTPAEKYLPGVQTDRGDA